MTKGSKREQSTRLYTTTSWKATKAFDCAFDCVVVPLIIRFFPHRLLFYSYPHPQSYFISFWFHVNCYLKSSMSTLPLYHSVPTDEKRSIPSTFVTREFDPRCIHPAAVGSEYLHTGAPHFDPRYIHPAAIGSEYFYIGAPRNAYQVTKDKYAGLSKVKKALVALAVVWFALAIGHQAARLVGGKCHHHAHHAAAEFGVKQWEKDHSSHRFGSPVFLGDGPHGCHGGPKDRASEELSSVATVYQSINVIGNDDATKILSANASFPLKLGHGKHFDLNFQGEGNVIISKAEEGSEDSTVNVLVESTWSSEEDDGVKMMSGKHSHALSVVSSESSSHIVHLVLPANTKRLPSISIFSTKDLKLDIHPSVQDIHVGKLSVKSESGDIKLPTLAVKKLVAETITGDVGGNFSVSNSFVVKTVTGNINATVNVVPHSHLGDEPNFHDFDAEHEHKRLHSLHGEHKRKKKHSGRRLHPEEERPSKWPLNLFKSKKENDEPEHAPLPPVFIGAFSTSGHIFLEIFGPNISTETNVFSHTGDVNIHHDSSFHGLYEVGSLKGSYDVIIREGRERQVLEEYITEEGGKQKGLAFISKHNKTEDSHKKRHFRNADSFDDEFPPPPGKGHGSGGPNLPHGPPPGVFSVPGHSEVFAHTEVGNVKIVL
ncbi:hypothetical protein C343_00465 [Cryptococcus neoformans C23]|nr:hypothetical protein C347_00543 [Cryptococcus neoformans var. grubii AD2-60a]OWZ48042.1 hypothetical protein C343_00465 [Cryptococcus neoformans var. grubii C23]OXC87138.1 hypothetical protein C344_00476 [Cryptococcus neoformans var. grubii AD1-7a]OXG40738.1 hypothetical protein C360_00516 [Cryptococcus neoformans var. grubii Bt15]OXG45402.1 hypothetical protein C359_00084 [Cryptococcus neoformans var. grubii Bt120]OXH39745.1 hypothetical protein J005_00471 [Cryptococcus neoformans var. gru